MRRVQGEAIFDHGENNPQAFFERQSPPHLDLERLGYSGIKAQPSSTATS